MSESVGYATLSVIPSARGFGAALTKSVAPEMAAAGRTSGLGFGKAMLAGIAGVAVVGVGVVVGLAAIGKTFHEMESTIRVTTGKSGKALEGLVTSAKNVGRGTAAPLADVGKTVAGLNQRLGLTGPVLEKLSSQFLAAGRITKQSLDMNTVTGSFNAFNIKGKDTSKALDDLFRISQATGVGINELAAAATKGAPAFRQFGLSFSDSAALVGVLDKAGINSGKTIGALTIGLTKFAKEGKAPGPALRSTIDQIQKFTKSGKDAAAIKLAAGIFGTKGAAQFVAAIKSGKVNLDDMMKSSGAGKDTILAAASATSTFSGKWAKFKNNVLIALEPLATRVFKAFGDGMAFMNDVGLPAVEKLGAAFASNVMPILGRFGNFLTGTVIPGVQALIAAFLAGGDDITSSGFAGVMERIGLAARKVSDWIGGTGVPAFKRFAAAINDNRGKVAAIAAVIGTLLIPVLINMGVQHTIAAAKAVAAWVTTKINAVTSAAAQVAASYRIIGGWVASAAAAVTSGATTVVIWGMYKAEAIKGAAITVASHARMAVAWGASRIGAVADAGAVSVAWITSAVTTSAAWVASTARTIAGLARQAVAMLAQKAVMVAIAIGTGLWTAAQWLLNAALTANPIGIVVVAIAALVAGIIWVATKTTWFQTIWEYMSHGIAVMAGWLWNTILKPYFTAWINVFKAVGAAVMWAWTNLIKPAWAALSAAVSFMWNSVMKPVFKFIIDAWMTVVGAIVNGAASAFGWVPGIGPKLKAAAAKFNTFRDNVNASLSGITGKTVNVGVSFGSSGTLGYGVVKGTKKRSITGAARGGPITGGIRGQDSVPRMLMPNEFVVTANGSNLAAAMAHYGIPGMAKGGLAVNASTPSAASIGATTDAAFGGFVKKFDFSKMLGSMGGTGGGAGKWASTVLAVLAMLGQSPANLGAVLRLINKESGGNPNAINLTDSNAKAGHPSGGLIQTIAGTFNAYAGAFRSLGMFNPFANIFAGLNYAISRYGSIAAIDPLHHAGGYANGTSGAAPGYAWVGERGPELLRFRGGEKVTPNHALGSGDVYVQNPFTGEYLLAQVSRVVDGHTQSMVDGLVYGGAA